MPPARSRARVLLREPTLADEAEWLARMRASRRFHRPWISMPVTPEAYRAYVARNAEERREQRIVCRAEDGALVGFCNVSEIVRGQLCSAFLGYGAIAEFAGRGYMSEGIQLVLREAFTTLRLHRLEANIQPGNEASIAVAHRAGFVREGFSERYLKVGGRWRDHERWAIRAEQWRAGTRRAAADPSSWVARPDREEPTMHEDESRRETPEDEPGRPGAEGGSGGSADVPPAAPSDDDDSALGDTDQHSDANA